MEVRVGELGRVLSVPLAPTFPLWLRRLDADVVHVHMPNPLGEVAALLAGNARPLVVSYHADIVRQARLEPAYRHLVGACLDRADAIVVGSRRIAETSPRLRTRSPTLIRYAVDTDRYSEDAAPASLVRGIREELDAPLVVAAGRLVYYKGFEHLIAAARDLEATVAIVGGGPLEGELRARAAGVPNVRIVGAVSEERLIAHLAAADCFVLPSTSRAESFGIATLEAQAMGVPAVVTDVGTGTVEAIEPGETGVVVRPGEPSELVRGIRSIIDSADGGRAMGEAARGRAVKLHDLRAQAEQIRQLYLGLV